MAWSSTPGPVISTLGEFTSILNGGQRSRITIDLTSPHRDEPLTRLEKMSRVTNIGEIGFYYLEYIETIITEYPDVRFPCLRRDKSETVSSYVRKLRTKTGASLWHSFRSSPHSRNHFVEHDGKYWSSDKKWDKCFPKYVTDNLEDAIGMYWEYYYEKAAELAARFEQVQIFELEELNLESSQLELLQFCGIAEPRYISVREN
jgi:hypothetical protein